jgi:uncharacterized protein DUF6549
MVQVLKYWRELLIFILVVAVAVSVHTCTGHKQHSESQQSVIDNANSKVEYFRNKVDQEVANRQAAEVDKQTLAESFKAELATIKSTLGVSKQDVQSIIKAEFQARYENTVGGVQVIHVKDTIHHQDSTVYFGQDHTKWLSIEAYTSPRYFHYRVTTFDSVLLTSHLKSQGFLKHKKLYVSGVNFNPNSHITGLNDIEVTDYKHKKFAVTAGAALSMYQGRFVVVPAITLGYKLFEF